MTQRMRICFGTVLATALISLSLDAQQVSGAKEAKVDLKTSRVYILVDKLRLGHPHGVEGNLKSGKLKLDAKSDAGQLVFDMSTFAADTDSARNMWDSKVRPTRTRRKK